MNSGKFLDRTACNRLLYTLTWKFKFGIQQNTYTRARGAASSSLLRLISVISAFPTPMFQRQITWDSNQAQRRSAHGHRDLGVSTEPVPRGCVVVALRGGG